MIISQGSKVMRNPWTQRMKNDQTRKEPHPFIKLVLNLKEGSNTEGKGGPQQQAEHLKDEKKVWTWGIYGNRHM
jgi:hypothetical protein